MTATPATAASPQVDYRPGEDTTAGIRVFDITPQAAERMSAPFKAARFTVAPNCSSPVDSHAVHEIWMIAQGTGELIYDGQKVRISASDMLYFEPPKPHEVRNDGTEPLVVFSVWWSAPGA